MILGLKLFGQGGLLCDQSEHLVQHTFFECFCVAFDITMTQLFMHTLFKFGDSLPILHPLYRAHLLLLDIVDASMLFLLFSRGSGSKRGSERLDVECGLNKLVLWNPLYDGDEVLDHIVVENLLNFESLKTFNHNRSPFLHRLVNTSGETKRTGLSFVLLLALKLYRITVICSLKSISISK